VKKAPQLQETVSTDTVSNWEVPEDGGFTPVMNQGWKLVDSHRNGKAEECPLVYCTLIGDNMHVYTVSN